MSQQIQIQKQIQIEKEQTVKKSKHKLSQVFLNATESQCSGALRKSYEDEKEKDTEYCALGLGLLYYGYKF